MVDEKLRKEMSDAYANGDYKKALNTNQRNPKIKIKTFRSDFSPPLPKFKKEVYQCLQFR